MCDSPLPGLRAHYDAMWDRAWPDVSRGDVECDRHLAGGLDPRRGLTLIARPDAALDGLPAFDIDFEGITISRGAVLVTGFPRDGTLERLRARLRDALRARGLAGTLDQRYRLVTAHSTVLRFIAPPADPARLAAVLRETRDVPLGTMRVESLQLVVNDWYMSSAAVEPVATITLRPPYGAR